MGARKTVDDSVILAGVRKLRRDTGACTYGDLAEVVGLTKATVKYRVRRLVQLQMLEVTDGRIGSIRFGSKAPRPSVELRLRIFTDGKGQPVDVELAQ